VNFVGGAVLYCLLDLDDVGLPIDKRPHQCPRGVIYLDLARVQGRVIRRECVWTKSALVSQAQRFVDHGSYRMARLGKLCTKVPRYACAPRHSFHCC
jgi:hypothetical protein